MRWVENPALWKYMRPPRGCKEERMHRNVARRVNKHRVASEQESECIVTTVTWVRTSV